MIVLTMYQQSVSLTDKLLFVPALLDRSGSKLISCLENLTTSNQQSVDASDFKPRIYLDVFGQQDPLFGLEWRLV